LKNFRLCRTSVFPPEKFFSISVDIANFHLILPKYFESLKIIIDDGQEKTVIEKINFLGFSTKVKTKHVMIPPNLHLVYILSGPLKGSTFIESYNNVNYGTEIIIDINLKIFGFIAGFNFLNNYIIKQMLVVMNEFITAVETKIQSENSNLLS